MAKNIQKLQNETYPKVLLVFGYERKSWILPFEELKARFHFVYLRYIDPSLEEISHTNEEKIYWSTFNNAQEILDYVKPVKVVFMSIYNGLDMALNNVCKRAKIPTYIFQHGIFTTYKDYREREILYKKRKIKNKENVKSKDTKQSFSSFRFVLKSFDIAGLISNWKILFYFYFQRKESSLFASRHFRFSARTPDFYICFSPKNARIHVELDRPPQGKFLYIGCPEFDSYFIDVQPKSIIKGKYYLHIDQAFSGNRFGENIVSREKMITFIEKLNGFCINEFSYLVIKLHPESYGSDWLPVHNNIIYIRETIAIVSLIKNASGCFGFFSTLLTPSILFNKVILFKMSESDFQNEMKMKELVLLLDFNDFDVSDIKFSNIQKDERQLQSFEIEYFYKTDGQSLERLEEILFNH